jgi:hypothetical protein
MRTVLTSIIISNAALIGLAQSDIIPSDLISIFIQLPLIGLFAWYVLKKDRDTREWIDQLMKEKDNQYVREMEAKDKQYERTISLFEKIIDRQDKRLAEWKDVLSDGLGKVRDTLTINTATVSESIRLSELVDSVTEQLKK